MIAVVSAACDSAAEKPTAEPEPPTPIPTVVTESESIGVDNAAGDIAGRIRGGGGFVVSGLADPEVRDCLTGILGDDALDNLGQGSGLGLEPESLAAFEECGLNLGRTGGGGFAGRVIDNPEVRECLGGILGEDALDNIGQGSGFGLEPESLAAMEECGLNFGDGGGGFRFGGSEGGFSGGLRGGFGGDGSFLECMTGELGDDALSLLRNPEGGGPTAEVQDALAKCGLGGIAIPVEPDGGIGDGAGPIPIEPAEEPTATEIPVSDLTIEQLTCLSSELDPSDLASAVVATSSGDLSEIPDEVLAALQTCGVGS